MTIHLEVTRKPFRFESCIKVFLCDLGLCLYNPFTNHKMVIEFTISWLPCQLFLFFVSLWNHYRRNFPQLSMGNHLVIYVYENIIHKCECIYLSNTIQRAKAQNTNSWKTHQVRKRWDIGLLRALSPRIMMMMIQYNIRLMQKSPADTAAAELQKYEYRNISSETG